MSAAGRDAKIAGAILTSEFYDLGGEVSVWKAYYGDDVSTYAERSSLPGLLETRVPLPDEAVDDETPGQAGPKKNALPRTARAVRLNRKKQGLAREEITLRARPIL